MGVKKDMLRASLADIPILDGYLHDSYFKPDDVVFDADKRCVAMDIERVFYEGAERGKVLWFIPVIRYPYIRSRIIMTGVEKTEQKRKNRGVDGPDGKHLLMDIEQKSENTIELGSTHLRITLTVAPDFELTVVDDSEPKKGSRAMDFCKGIFHGLDEIDKLRVNAPQSPAGNQGQTHSNERRQFTENIDGP